MTAADLLRPRRGGDLSARLARSAESAGARTRTADIPGWLAARTRAHRFRVHRVSLDRLRQWSAEPGTGDLVHCSGRFFAVRGLAASDREGPVRSWQQPIIHQPEVGLLGLLAAELDGVLHFLLQAKMEPGNPNLVQLSPTVQATRSNYQRVHSGARVPFLEHFTDPAPGRVLADSLQSEHGAWFFRKANRNMLVEADAAAVPPGADYCWLTLGQLGELLRLDHVVNMDVRSILGCLPLPGTAPPTEPRAHRSDIDLRSWLTAEQAGRDADARLMPLGAVEGWQRDGGGIRSSDGRFFQVVGVSVEAGSREVAGWDQPLVEPRSAGIAAFLTRRLGGIPHLLVHARGEAGFAGGVEVAPTVQCAPRDWDSAPPADRPRFLPEVLAELRSGRARYSAMHSEEGGRFLNASVRYAFVPADPGGVPDDPPRGYMWATADQLTGLAAAGRQVNVQARTLLACLSSGAVQL